MLLLCFQRAAAGIKRINLDGLRWRVFDAKGQVSECDHEIMILM